MRIVYALEETPESIDSSIFLVGPTPREACSISWRAEMIEHLIDADFNGTIFVPEPRNGHWTGDYTDQIDWELKHLEMADVIIAWVPRDMESMPALTTNVEFGKYLSSNKIVYGRPENAQKCRYLDSLYAKGFGEPHVDMASTAKAAVEMLGEPMTRTGGERFVPLHIFRTEMFQKWLAAQKAVGNRLDHAQVLWEFRVGPKKFLFSYVLAVNVWVESEQRHKSNEFTFTRRDISTIMAYYRPPAASMLDTKIVLVKEFRSPCRNAEAFVYELPGGSSFKPGKDPLEQAAEELAEETGLVIDPNRFFFSEERQLASTLSTHTASLFSVELTEAEIKDLEAISENKTTFGVANDSEKTYVAVESFRYIIGQDLADWSTIGMIANALL